jgi:hypothetical protein
VSAKMDAFIKSKGLAAAQQYTAGQLKTVGVDEAAILAKLGKEKVGELQLDDLVALAGDYKAIENGDANADELFDLKPRASAAATDLKSKLRARVEQGPKAEAPQAKAEPAARGITVTPGKQPFTYYVSDGFQEFLTSVDGDTHSCNCEFYTTMQGTCKHIEAVEHHRQA